MRIVKRTIIYQGRIIQLVKEVLQVKGKRIVRETVQHPGAVVIVPMLDNKHIVFVRQYRHAVRRQLLELPAGTLEVGEHRRACAKRELEEEAGWSARILEHIGQFYPSPGLISEQITVFLARGLTPIKPHTDLDELLIPVVMPLTEALAKIRSGVIRDAKSIIGVLFADRILRYRKH